MAYDHIHRLYGIYLRNPGTSRSGSTWDLATINAVWQKAKIIPGSDPNVYRVDCCNALIIRNYYGNVDSKYGWEIDHINPVANGGSDSISNLQPLQWENNRHKSDTVGNWTCKVP